MLETEHPRSYPITIVDVFAERRLAGNQLAVVHDAGDLSDVEMQSIALETNFSETTFVLDRDSASATVRIFTPAWELPFAGHPTVGTAWVLSGGEGPITLNLPIGPVQVEFVDGIGWMTPPEVVFHGGVDLHHAAELVGLEIDDFDTNLPCEYAEVGPQFALLPVKNLACLKKAALNGPCHARLLDEGYKARCVFLFSAEAYGTDADFSSRMFFNSAGLREDPATGSANTAFAAYLRKHQGNLGRIVVDQGVEINRPSRIYLDVGKTLRVGGKTQAVIEGHISI